MKYLQLIRPSHWTKNIFVFAALVFGRKLFGSPDEVVTSLFSAFGAFVCFCMASSAVYVFNDIVDRKADRAHPSKSSRPIASGQVSVFNAAILAILLAVAAIVSSYLMVSQLAIIIVAYLVLMFLYSLVFKKVIILDVIVISMGFVLRAIAGAIAIGVFISFWLIICTFALCLFLGFGKRRSEIAMLEEDAQAYRSTLGSYTPELLAHMINVTSGLAIVCFLLYSMDERTFEYFQTKNLVFTTPMVLYCIFRFSLQIQKGIYSGPVEIILKDRAFQAGFLSWTLACIFIIYAKNFGLCSSSILVY